MSRELRAPIAVARDADCRFIYANDALARLLDLPPADANISLTPPSGEQPRGTESSAMGGSGRDQSLPMQYAIAHRTHLTNDIEIVRADGLVLYVQNHVEPLYDPGWATSADA